MHPPEASVAWPPRACTSRDHRNFLDHTSRYTHGVAHRVAAASRRAASEDALSSCAYAREWRREAWEATNVLRAFTAD